MISVEIIKIRIGFLMINLDKCNHLILIKKYKIKTLMLYFSQGILLLRNSQRYKFTVESKYIIFLFREIFVKKIILFLSENTPIYFTDILQKKPANAS